jgi:hypothetical protein
MNNNIIKTKAYLYQLQKGILNIYEGNVYATLNGYDGVFKTKNKNIACSSQPKLVFNSTVWIPEINDDLARELLIQYEEYEISLLENLIKNHRMKIEVLKGKDLK